MRIAVSGTHGSSERTFDVVAAYREHESLPDPFELIDESFDSPEAAVFDAPPGDPRRPGAFATMRDRRPPRWLPSP